MELVRIEQLTKVYGTGEGRISVGQSHWDLTDIDRWIEIDSEQMNIYKVYQIKYLIIKKYHQEKTK